VARSPDKTSTESAPRAASRASAKVPVKATSTTSPAPAPKASAKAPVAKPKAVAAKAPAVRKPAPNPMLNTPSNTPKDDEPEAVAAPEAPSAALVPLVRSTRKSSAKSRYGAPMPVAPLPPPTSRFADRFAPPRPPTRQMKNLEDDAPRVAVKADPKLANAWKTKAGIELSEAEVLAMPESEYMGDKQLDFFRATLKKLRDDLLSNAGETTEHLREDTSIVPDPADRATIEEEHALELRTRDRERKLLKKITQSLGRIDSGEYGFCDETGEPIGLGRLIARPTATLSLEAQQRRELKQKMFGD